jgi:hypothetical protein
MQPCDIFPTNDIFVCRQEILNKIRTQHVHKEKFSHVAVSKMSLFFSNRCTNHSRFLGNHRSFFGRRLASANLADQIS